MLLSTKVDPILKGQGYKKDMLVVCSISHIEMIFTLLTEVIVFYI